MTQARRIVFHHVPKCGGMSIAAGLALTYFPCTLLRYGRKGFPAHLNARAASSAAGALGLEPYAYRRHLLEYQLAAQDRGLIAGHYPFSPGAHARHGADWAFVTLLRDPVERWYSEYFWNRYKDHDYARTSLGIEEYLETAQGLRDTRSYVNFFAECLDPAAPVTSAESRAALENIEKFDVVGLLEDLPRFQRDLHARFGRRPVFFKRNKSPAGEGKSARPGPESAFHRHLLSLLEADREIYAAARRRLGA